MAGGVLPGGYFDAAGRLHRDFDLAVLTGREEELLTQAHHPRPTALVTEVLSRCLRRLGDISPVPSSVARDLLVGDRLYLMLQLRRATFGDRVRADLACPWPGCGERVSLDFAISGVPVEAPPQPGPVHVMTLSAAAAGCDDRQVAFRLPTGADQEELSELVDDNEGMALTALLVRCVRRIGTGGRGFGADSFSEPQGLALLPGDRTLVERGGSIMVVPLIFGEQVGGVLGFAKRQPHWFDEGDVEVAAGIAVHVVVAIQHQRLAEEQRRLAAVEGRTFQPIDGVLHRLHLPKPEAGNELLGLGEGAVGNRGLGCGEGDALAFGAGLEAFGSEEHACFYQFFVELAHVGEEFGAGEDACFGFFACFDEDHATHFVSPFVSVGAGVRGGFGRLLHALYLNVEPGAARSTWV